MNVSNSNPIASPADLYGNTSPADVAERQKVVQAVSTLSESNMFGENRELTYAIDRTTQRMVIRVIDRDTRETVAQLPPEYVLRLSASLKQGS
jgi:uncharacterized FlaG/YvyC family protein